MTDELFRALPEASWEVSDRGKIVFPVDEITESGGNRIVRHRRPNRAGARLQSTGSQERIWRFKAFFNNSMSEGVVDGVPLYPTVLRRLLRSFEVQECGWLTLPTIGAVRARAETYSRVETSSERDEATLDLTFVEDNEESLSRAALNPPGTAATLVKLSQQTEFTAQRNGVWDADTASLTVFASQVESLLLAPGRAVADLGAQVRSHRNAIHRIMNAADTAARQVGGLFIEPRGSSTERQLRQMLDRESYAEIERTSSRPRARAWTVDVERTSIYDVAARFRQDAEELLELNAARITDPFDLERGDVIRIFESAR